MARIYHKWEGCQCIRCGLRKKRKATRRVILGAHDRVIVYSRALWYYREIPGQGRTGGFSRPDCLG